MTLKDHKEIYRSKPRCRLINPNKSEIERISKSILDKINTEIRRKTDLVQWKDPEEMIDSFTNLKNKNQYEFIKFDEISFYTSITEKLLDKATLFGKNNTEIEKKDKKIIKNAANSVLCNGKDIWIKREKN